MTTKEKVDALQDVSVSKMNNWELDFLDDISEKDDFTSAQAKKIDELYEKHVEGD